MTAGILAATLGLLIAAACIGIPQVVRTRRQQPNDDDTLAYLKETSRSARDIATGNAAVRAAQQRNDTRSQDPPQPENADMLLPAGSYSERGFCAHSPALCRRQWIASRRQPCDPEPPVRPFQTR